MSWWVFGPRRRVLAALARDDRPIRHLYGFEARTTIAELRDRLAGPGDHETLAWPDFEAYRDYLLSNFRRDGRRQRVWPEERDAWRFPMLSRFTVVLKDGTIEFWPDEWQSAPSRKGPPYVVKG